MRGNSRALMGFVFVCFITIYMSACDKREFTCVMGFVFVCFITIYVSASDEVNSRSLMGFVAVCVLSLFMFQPVRRVNSRALMGFVFLAIWSVTAMTTVWITATKYTVVRTYMEPANTRRSGNAGSMLGHRRRRLANINSASGERLVPAGK